MSRDGTLPPGCSHADIERRFGGVDDDTLCCECSEELTGNELEDDICDSCGLKHYRGLYFNARRDLERLRRETILPAPIHTAPPAPASQQIPPGALPAVPALAPLSAILSERRLCSEA